MNNLCMLCPNECKVDRNVIVGACNSGAKMKIAKYYLHPYEEPVLSGKNGSGTIFFTGCSLKCIFCQNYDVSRNLTGKEITPDELAHIFKQLENTGAENINLVTPTQYSDGIIKALSIYKPKIPVVYNTHGYERIEILEKLLPYIDVFMPDIKYFSEKVSSRYTGIKNYFSVTSKAVKFMMDNKPTIFDDNGMMRQGVIVRHLILPLNTDDSIEILKWLDGNIANGAYVSVMSQYTPFGNIDEYPELKRKITKREYDKVTDYLFNQTKIKNYFLQDRTSAELGFIPKWDY